MKPLLERVLAVEGQQRPLASSARDLKRACRLQARHSGRLRPRRSICRSNNPDRSARDPRANRDENSTDIPIASYNIFGFPCDLVSCVCAPKPPGTHWRPGSCRPQCCPRGPSDTPGSAGLAAPARVEIDASDRDGDRYRRPPRPICRNSLRPQKSGLFATGT
jgi:hypothetical protein